jgi:SNF2 family DNA or RNA helicase
VGAGAGASAKFEYLMEQLPAMVETGRRVIVFSQFVEMLDLIDAALTAEGIPFAEAHRPDEGPRDPRRALPGRRGPDLPHLAPRRRRRHHAHRRRHGDPLRPLVEPAVEAQATDRAHRIGQDKTVFVYKLIAAGTVEEKMVELQARKKALVDGVLEGTASGLAFTEDDIEALFAPLPG